MLQVGPVLQKANCGAFQLQLATSQGRYA